MASAVYTLFQDSLHVNETTGCYLWDGELDRSGQPIADFLGNRVRIRDLLLREIGQDPRETEVAMMCENPRCILSKHIEVRAKPEAERKPVEDVAYSEDELNEVSALISQGYRQETIAEKLGTSRSRVAKMARVLKSRQEAGQ